VPTDEKLMDRYLARADQRAFAAIYARHAPMLRRMIHKRVRSAADAEDVLQQTFLRLHLARDSYRSGEPLRPWLCTIAGNLTRDHLRRAVRRPEHPLEPERHAVAELEPPALEARRPSEALTAALRHLCEVTQHIMQEHFMADRALVDIARELGQKPSTVRVRLHRGCRRLRDQLAV
jgi:RNA polymerase sigma-70 factor (ECF subfamily)